MTTHFDTIIIGGGPSGLMASIASASNGNSTCLIEKNKQLGKKLLISGGGRCNVTNNVPYEEIIKHIPGNGKFLYSPFSIFDNQSIIEFIESNGVPLKEEDHGRMFPVTDKSKDILNVFLNKLSELNVSVQTETTVNSIEYDSETKLYNIITKQQSYQCTHLVISTGGKSVPKTGSTGDGYKFAAQFSHTITELFPTEVPILSDEPFIQSNELKGLSLKGIALSVLDKKGKPVITHEMDMLFTHFGISGPAALRCSQFVYKQQKKQKTKQIKMAIDLFPNKNETELMKEVSNLIAENKNKLIINSLKSILQERFIQVLIDRLNIDIETTGHHLKNEDKILLVKTLKHFSFSVNGTKSIEDAFVTGGGIKLKEINPKTLESKLQNNLYFSGELLDIHGYTGGYNITSALVTGYVAGYSTTLK